MRGSWKRQALALTAVAGLFLAGCGGDDGGDETAQGNGTEQDAGGDGGASPGAGQSDPSENVEDGVYRGNGVAMPVPDGWSVQQQQGAVAAQSDDGTQQLTAQAIETGQVQTGEGESLELNSLLDNVRQQVDQEADTDEEVELANAEQAHQLTYLGLPAQQEDQPDTSTTIVVASGEEGLMGEFAYTATAEDYNEDVVAQLVDEGGFDPDSEPPEPQQPAPGQGGAGGGGAGQGGGTGQGGAGGGQSGGTQSGN